MRLSSCHITLILVIMSPLKVFPEEEQKKSSVLLGGHFDIPVSTQVKIYATLDSKVPPPHNPDERRLYKSRSVLQRQLSKWFPQGLLWTDDDNDDMEDKDNGEKINRRSDSTLVLDMHNSVPTMNTPTSPSFTNIMQSFDLEGERILLEDFSSSSSSSSSNNEEFNPSYPKIDDRLGLGDIDARVRKRRGVHTDDLDSSFDDPDSVSQFVPQPQPPLSTICNGVPAPRRHQPGEDISCYTCVSSTSDSDPKCDHRLWKYLRHSEKFNLRGRCGHKDHVCMKRVNRRYGERLTERGCVTTPLLIPSQDGNNSTFTELVGEGCYTHSQKNGFLTTACFCKNSLCNNAPRKEASSSLFSIAAICLALLLYGLALAFFKEG